MTCFSWFELCFEIKPRYIFFFFSMQNIWNDWKIYYFPVIFIYKRFNACCSLWTFIVSSTFNVTITAYWKHLLSFLLIEFVAASLFFIQTEESIYMIHHDWDLFYDIYNTINKHYQEKITTFHWFFQLILIFFFFSDSKTSSITSSASSFMMIFMLSLSEYISCSSSLSFSSEKKEANSYC